MLDALPSRQDGAHSEYLPDPTSRGRPPLQRKPTLPALARFWFHYGMISWGGLWAMIPKMESELLHRGWLSRERFQAAMAASTLIPGPTFLALAGLTGYQLRGAVGAAVSLLALMLPPTILVVFAMLWVKPEMLSGPLAPVTRGLTVAVIGVLLGNAYRMAAGEPRKVWRGPLILLLTTGAILAGAPVALTVVGAILLGSLLLREVRP